MAGPSFTTRRGRGSQRIPPRVWTDETVRRGVRITETIIGEEVIGRVISACRDDLGYHVVVPLSDAEHGRILDGPGHERLAELLNELGVPVLTAHCEYEYGYEWPRHWLWSAETVHEHCTLSYLEGDTGYWSYLDEVEIGLAGPALDATNVPELARLRIKRDERTHLRKLPPRHYVLVAEYLNILGYTAPAP